MDLTAFLPVLFTLIFFLFFFVSIVRSLKKIAEKTKKPARSQHKLQTGKKTGWKDLFGDVVAQIQKEIKAAKEQQEQLARDKKATAGKGNTRQSKLVWDKNAPLPSPPPLPAAETRKKKIRARTPESQPQEPATPPAPENATTVSPPIFETSADELRKAVAWSEILAPPLAMREDHDRFRDF